MLSTAGIFTEQFYAFDKKDGELCLKKARGDKIRPVVVIGREHCYECRRDLPIGKIDEARKAAMMMDDLSPFPGVNFFLLESLGSDKTRVHFYIIKQDTYQQLAGRSWFLVPESMLLHLALQQETAASSAQVTLGSRKLFSYHSKDGFKSALVKSSTSELNFIAQHSSGAVEQAIEYNEASYPRLLLQSLRHLPGYTYAQVFNKNRLVVFAKKLPLKAMALAGAGVFIAYLALSSLWLYSQQSYLAAQIEQQRANLDEVFSLQSALNKLVNRHEELASNRKLPVVTSSVWEILTQVIEQDAELLSVNYFNNEYTVRIKAQKSTPIVQYLSENNAITTPKMVAPVVKSRGKEILSVKFSLLTKGAEDVAG